MNALLLAVAASAASTTGLACAAGDDDSLRFDPAAALAQPDETVPQASSSGLQWSTTFGAAALFGGDGSDVHGAAYVSFDTFIAKDFEFALEITGYYFDQDDVDDAVGLALTPMFRWHFLSASEGERDWSLYTDFGIGVMGSTETISRNGSEFNFTPRLGLGLAANIGDGWRILTGARWQHISNGRIFGGDDNESFDAIMVYAGLSIPF